MTRVLIIAEAGVNHNGDINLALQLVKKASEAGADAIKFQSFIAENLVTSNAPKAGYQIKNTQETGSQFEMLKKLELNYDQHVQLLKLANDLGIRFISSPFDLESIDMLNNLHIDTFKIPSGEITNIPYLRKIASFNKKIILSTGMSYLAEVERAIHELTKGGTDPDNIIVLHCNTEYPTPFSDVNLRAMLTIQNTFGVKIGYSDHTIGTDIPIAAVALGAEVIEKHFTLDRNLPGPDHKASMEPAEFKNMVESIRNVEAALGSPVKQPSASELPNIQIARKSIVARKNIMKGETFSPNNITVKRPGNGLSPLYWDQLIGTKATKDYVIDELINF